MIDIVHTAPADRVQGSHRVAHHDSQRSHRQCPRLPLLFRRPPAEKHLCRALGRSVGPGRSILGCADRYEYNIGYNAPQNLQNYALYLDARIRAYRDLKHDAIRVQSETNRDMRNSAAINSAATEEQQQEHHEGRRRFGRGRKSEEPKESTNGNSAHQRSKTIAGRKLRVMTVEKGLLRETKVVQKMIDSLVECRVSGFVGA